MNEKDNVVVLSMLDYLSEHRRKIRVPRHELLAYMDENGFDNAEELIAEAVEKGEIDERPYAKEMGYVIHSPEKIYR